MPFNLLKQYSDLLEIIHLSSNDCILSLKGIFLRDIENNPSFTFRGKVIRPVKKEGVSTMETLFAHLTTEDEIILNDDGTSYKRRTFEHDRSVRLHWIRFLIELKKINGIEVFSVEERDSVKRKDVIRTYIYDVQQQYVIVLEPQKSNLDYYLLTAYHLNKEYGLKQIKKKIKKKLTEIH